MKVAISGAGGQLGAVLRKELLRQGLDLRSGGHRSLTPLIDNEDLCAGDLQDAQVVDQLLNGVDVLIHLAGTSTEQALDKIIHNNLLGLVAVYEGARRNGVKRIVFASSNHAIGMHSVNTKLNLDCDFRPDGFYGLSKMWGEGLARMYWDKHGIESVCIRIGSCLPEPTEFRHLSTWLGHEDFFQLIGRCISTPEVGFTVVWGVSANTRSYWDTSDPGPLGYLPTQNAEDYAPAILAKANPLDPIAQQYQGGGFVTLDFSRN